MTTKCVLRALFIAVVAAAPAAAADGGIAEFSCREVLTDLRRPEMDPRNAATTFYSFGYYQGMADTLVLQFSDHDPTFEERLIALKISAKAVTAQVHSRCLENPDSTLRIVLFQYVMSLARVLLAR